MTAAVEPDDIDLTDLDRFADGFPHDVFTRLRRDAPVWFHPATAHTPGREGFWVLTRYDDVLAAGGGGRTRVAAATTSRQSPGARSRGIRRRERARPAG